MTIQDLNAQFAIPGTVNFAGDPGGVPAVSVENAHASARIALNGANIMHFQSRGAAPVLWLSPNSAFRLGKAIRGGIPICWPWFGPHPTDKAKPDHGFARTSLWRVLGTKALAGGETEVRLGLNDSDATRALWPHVFDLELVVTVGAILHTALIARNTGDEPFICTSALHAYFSVGDASAIRVHGLDDLTYIDKNDGMRAKQQHGPAVIDAPTDRVYQNTATPVTIEDPAMKRRITIAKAGSNTTVVWNPWRDAAASMSDFGAGLYTGMVCVEAANAFDDAVTIAPGDEHRLEAVISLEKA